MFPISLLVDQATTRGWYEPNVMLYTRTYSFVTIFLLSLFDIVASQVWYARRAKLKMVDVTATVRALHQNDPRLNPKQNGHKTRRVKDGMQYNFWLAMSLGYERRLALRFFTNIHAQVPLAASMRENTIKQRVFV